MTNVLTITWLTFHEAWRRRMVQVALVLGVAFVLLYGGGLALIVQEIRTDPEFTDSGVGLSFGYNLLTMAGFYVVHFLTVMLAIFASVDTISGEIASHTIQTIVTKPIRRWQVLAGKWLGYALMMAVYIGMLTGGILLSLYLVIGYMPPNPLQGALLLLIEALVLVSLSLLCGTRVSTLTNGVLLFMLYGIAFIGSYVEQFGSLLHSQAAVRVGIVTSLLLPVEVLWRRILYVLQPSILRQLPSPFMSNSVPSAAMVVYAMIYAAVALAFAIRSFNRREL
jgi:ABC-type transport system involved in multi-copper enzyme maturation permease subunit